MAQTCCTIIIPGPPGTPAPPCTPCINGKDAYTRTTGMFTMPAVAATANQGVVDSSWASPGLIVVTQNLGYFLVTAVPDGVTLTLQNLGYSVNVAPGTIQGAGWLVIPSGPQGVTGPAGPNIFEVYANIPALRASVIHGIGYGALLQGQSAAYDGQGGVWTYDATSMGVDDGTDTTPYVRPADVLVGNTGRWRKVI